MKCSYVRGVHYIFPNFLTENGHTIMNTEIMKDRAVTKWFAWLCEVGGGRYSTALL